jgi:hypothetical protein
MKFAFERDMGLQKYGFVGEILKSDGKNKYFRFL